MARKKRSVTATQRKVRARRKASETEEELDLPLPTGAGLIGALLLLASLAGIALVLALSVDLHLMKIDLLHEAQFQKIMHEQMASADSGIVGIYCTAGLFTAFGIFARRRWAWTGFLLLSVLDMGWNAGVAALHHDLIPGINAAVKFCLLIYWIRPAVSDAFI